jgi:hypothetical protein
MCAFSFAPRFVDGVHDIVQHVYTQGVTVRWLVAFWQMGRPRRYWTAAMVSTRHHATKGRRGTATVNTSD